VRPCNFATSSSAVANHFLVEQVILMDSVTRTAFSSTANFDARSSKLLNVSDALRVL
jgi:hypothetical protein